MGTKLIYHTKKILSKKIKMYNRRSAWQKNVNCYYCYACFNYRHRVSGPAYILTWNWQIAKESVAVLAALEPRVLACGHGIVMIGSGTAHELRAFSDRFL